MRQSLNVPSADPILRPGHPMGTRDREPFVSFSFAGVGDGMRANAAPGRPFRSPRSTGAPSPPRPWAVDLARLRGKLAGVAALACLLVYLVAADRAWAVERFPPPDFTSHQLPETTTPSPPWLGWEYLDMAFLFAALVLATYLALVRRSRRGLFALTVVSLAWLGFWRSGCVCPIGAIQNVTLAAVEPSYTVPFSVVLIFVLPLMFALFFGRTFCAAVCPLGAVQELVAVRPLKVPAWIDHSLGLLPYVYLGGAVLYAATGTTFIICNYDPFVGFFRLSASASMLVFGACFLVIGLFVGRPYCRYLCPYGALLGLCSKVSKQHVRIPPGECINCRLCEDACPYGAIQPPTTVPTAKERLQGRRRLALLLVLFPILVAGGAWTGHAMGIPLSRLHPKAALAERIRLEETGLVEGTIDASDAFRNTGRSSRALYAEARALHKRFSTAGAWFGGWIGLVIGAKLIHLSIHRRRTEYQPDRTNCVSCGRCFWYCPVEQLRLGWIQTLPDVPSTPKS